MQAANLTPIFTFVLCFIFAPYNNCAELFSRLKRFILLKFKYFSFFPIFSYSHPQLSQSNRILCCFTLSHRAPKTRTPFWPICRRCARIMLIYRSVEFHILECKMNVVATKMIVCSFGRRMKRKYL